MKRGKQVFSVLLVVLMLLTSVPIGGFIAPKASAASYDGVCGANGDNLKWSFDDETGELKITGSGEMEDYYNHHAPWYSYNDSIKTVTIGNNITSIGDYAFNYCSSLESITIPRSVTSIGYKAFDNCDSLEITANPRHTVRSLGIGCLRTYFFKKSANLW